MPEQSLVGARLFICNVSIPQKCATIHDCTRRHQMQLRLGFMQASKTHRLRMRSRPPREILSQVEPSPEFSKKSAMMLPASSGWYGLRNGRSRSIVSDLARALVP